MARKQEPRQRIEIYTIDVLECDGPGCTVTVEVDDNYHVSDDGYVLYLPRTDLGQPGRDSLWFHDFVCLSAWLDREAANTGTVVESEAPLEPE